jgi:hypothetical protein
VATDTNKRLCFEEDNDDKTVLLPIIVIAGEQPPKEFGVALPSVSLSDSSEPEVSTSRVQRAVT